MRLFEPEDYAIVSKWFDQRQMHVPFVCLPRIGFIEDHFAAGFMIQTDTPVACIDFLVSNPESDIKKRGEAIKSVVLSLIEECKRRGFKRIKCDSTVRSVENLAISLGFTDLGNFRTFNREI